MTEYVKIINGAKYAKMLNSEHNKHVLLTRSETSPGEGWYPVQKVLPKPTPAAGEELAYSYTVREGTAYKEYFIVPAGTSFMPRVFSKLSLEMALFKAGLLSAVDAFIDSQTITNQQGDEMPLRRAYNTAITFREDNEYFAPMVSAVKTTLGLTDEQVEAILAASVAPNA